MASRDGSARGGRMNWARAHADAWNVRRESFFSLASHGVADRTHVTADEAPVEVALDPL